jgi:hypothetical protein
MAEMFVGTIHAFCLELLKSESPKHLKFEVLNEVQQGLFVDRNSSKSGLTTSTDITGAALKRYRTQNITSPRCPSCVKRNATTPSSTAAPCSTVSRPIKGRVLGAQLPERLIRFGAAAIFLVTGAVTLIEAVYERSL